MRFIIPAFAISLLIASASAQDAPFCVVSSSGRHCHYYDAPTCQQFAADVRGACVVNQQGGQPSAGSAGTGGVWGAFSRGAQMGSEMGERARNNRDAHDAAQANAERAAVWTSFCERMQQNDFDMLEALAPRITTEEYASAARNYVNRANYCRSLAQ